tara:strand:- start:1145 stop:1876 length:732 start_codon:yes stop_codon:yes gene_type:complete
MGTKATLILTSDISSQDLSITTSATLTKAGGAVALAQATGLARTDFVVGGTAPFNGKVIYRADDAATDGSNKVYLKNTSATATDFFTVLIDQEEMGRLYAGDWAFFPWTATSGVKETFTVTLTLGSGDVEVGDSWEFDGIKTTSTTAVLNTFAAEIHAKNYPNWTTTISGAAISFTARRAVEDGVITGNTAITGDVLVDLNGSNLTAPITAGDTNPSTRSESDIIVVPSVATTMVLEHMLFNE